MMPLLVVSSNQKKAVSLDGTGLKLKAYNQLSGAGGEMGCSRGWSFQEAAAWASLLGERAILC